MAIAEAVHTSMTTPIQSGAERAGEETRPDEGARAEETAVVKMPTSGVWLKAVQVVLSLLSLVVMALSILLSVGPRFLPYETFVVLSGSMEPAIPLGSVVIVRPVPAESLRVGDVITYRRVEEPDITFTHRITQVVRPGASPVLRTKGDANRVEDPWDLQLRGPAWKYVAAVPYAGRVFFYAQTETGRLVLLVVPAVILGVLWLRDIWAEKRAPATPNTGRRGAR